VILVVDRTELEGQLKGWVERLLGEMQKHDIAVKRANSRTDLQSLLDADFRGLVIAMIHNLMRSARIAAHGTMSMSSSTKPTGLLRRTWARI